MIICPVITHNADCHYIRQNTEELRKIFFIAVLRHFIPKYPVCFLKNFNFISSKLTDNSYAESGTRERLTPYKFFRNSQLFADLANLILEQISKRLYNAEELHIIRNIYPVVMCFYNGGIALTAFNTVRINCALCEKALILLLSDFTPENIEKLSTDNFSFLLRICYSLELCKELFAAVYTNKIHIKKGCKGFFNKITLILTHQALIHKNTGKLLSYCTG